MTSWMAWKVQYNVTKRGLDANGRLDFRLAGKGKSIKLWGARDDVKTVVAISRGKSRKINYYPDFTHIINQIIVCQSRFSLDHTLELWVWPWITNNMLDRFITWVIHLTTRVKHESIVIPHEQHFSHCQSALTIFKDLGVSTSNPAKSWQTANTNHPKTIGSPRGTSPYTLQAHYAHYAHFSNLANHRK